MGASVSTHSYLPLTVRIDFRLENPTAGVFFAGPDPINAPNVRRHVNSAWLLVDIHHKNLHPFFFVRISEDALCIYHQPTASWLNATVAAMYGSIVGKMHMGH